MTEGLFSDRHERGDLMNLRKQEPTANRRAYQVNEAVAAYRLSRSTLYKLMSAGTLRSVKVGGRRLIPVEALEALIAGGKQ
jgi:excisionase family DNA binding protein